MCRTLVVRFSTLHVVVVALALPLASVACRSTPEQPPAPADRLGSQEASPTPKPAEKTVPTTPEPAKTEPKKTFQIVNTMAELFKIVDAAPPDMRAQVVVDAYTRKYPAIFAPNVLSISPDTFDATLAERARIFAASYDRLRPVMNKLNDGFDAKIIAGRERFRDAFPDFAWTGKVYLVASLQSFNGAVREVNGERALLLGLDVIADAQPDKDIMVLLHHELFHFHQNQEGPNVLWAAMWSEGLAVHASMLLNPGATLDEALPLVHVHDPKNPALDIPDRRASYAKLSRQTKHELITRFMKKMDSGERADYSAFFLGRADDQLGERPVRSAYWIGTEVARKIVTRENIAAVSQQPVTALESDIRAALNALEAEHRP